VPASKYTETQRAEAVELYRTQGPTAVQDQLGIAKGTVAGWAKEAGVRTVRNERTYEATQAVKFDAALARAELIQLQYERAKKVMARLNAPTFKTLVPVSPGRQEPQELDFVPAVEERALSGSVSAYASVAKNLEAVNSGQDMAATDSVVDSLLAGFRAHHASAAKRAPVGDESR